MKGRQKSFISLLLSVVWREITNKSVQRISWIWVHWHQAVYLSHIGAFDTIKKAYKESNDAVQQAKDTGNTVKESSDLRQTALDMQNRVQPANTKDLEKLEDQLATKPNLTPTAVQVRLLYCA